ncbi:hypothetical protein KKA95_02830 [Patescibacteria group bacterium]|nr:hypothetical protein [Patescibacteria group bacterium]
MIKTKIKSLVASLMLIAQAVIMPIAVADFLPVRAYGADTVAGYASLLRTSLVNPAQDMVFVVEKPDMSVVRIPAKADLEGIAQADLYGHQTKVAGDYKVAVVFPGSSNSSPQNSFHVYADQISATQSDITSTTQMLSADGEEKTFVTVTLYDAYRNPISNHQAQLISSRKDDVVTAISGGVSDRYGRSNFKVTSKYAGISVFTALDATANKVLADREEVVFFTPTRKETSFFGGNMLSASLFTADIGQSSNVIPGPVDSFDIEGLPSNVKVNQDQTITIVARDKDGNTATNYTGTILISTPDDEHAVLPNNGEYTFKESDQGEFTFNLALRFTQIGNQVIQVFDKDNWKISGEFELEVVPAQAVVTPDVSSSLRIKSPIDGSELGNSLVVISGQGDPNINLKVFDNDTKIGDSETDSDGFFSYQAQNLISGAHTFYAMSDNGDVSASVTIQIDTLPPVLNYFEVSPDGVVTPGIALSVTAQSESNLQEVKIRLQGIEEILSESGSQPGTYSATVAAPVTDGTFPIDVILIDSLSNKAEFLNQSSVQTSSPSETPPPTVEGSSGAAGDGLVILTWHEVTGHDSEIQKYRIYYGTDYKSLTQIMETEGASTSQIIEGLENGSQYFFAVTAVDSKGLESKEKSITIAITPESEEVVMEEVEDTTGMITEDTTGGTTGSIYTDVTGSAIGGIQGVAYQDSVILYWSPYTQATTYFYKVYFGLQSGQYDDYVITKNNSPTVTISDLITGIPYYFTVVALDLAGREISPLSTEYAMVPTATGATFHAVSSGVGGAAPLTDSQLTSVPSTEETGPEAIWIVMASLVVAHFLYHHKKKVLN